VHLQQHLVRNRSVGLAIPSRAPSALLGAGPQWWQWPTVLSLDAPIVAALWQWQLARAVGAPLGWQHVCVLMFSVWLAYVLDRWIEGWRLAADQLRTQRHAFYKRHRAAVAGVWAVALAADLAVALTRLTGSELTGGLMLLAAVVAYLLSHQWVHRNRSWRPPKEVCIALLLGGGAIVFIVASHPVRLEAVAAPLALFVLLCFVNCVLISVWERDVDRAHGQTSLALQLEERRHLGSILPWTLASVSALAAMYGGGPAAASAAASGALLGIVDRAQPRIGRQLARTLADVALMTPAVPLLLALVR
jgi:hypothetical protein